MALGEKIKEYRIINKYSQEKLAELVGVSRQAVTKWEANQSAPSTDNLLKLVDIYGISLDELIHDNADGLDKNYKRTYRKWNKIISFLLVIIIVLIILFQKDLGIVWTLVNLIVLTGLIIGGIYIAILLVKALNKYIR